MSANDRKSDDAKKKRSAGAKNPERRKVLKGGVVVGGAIVGSALTLPKKWTRPIVEAVVVPAQAQISPGAPTLSPTQAPTPAPTLSPTTPVPTSVPTTPPPTTAPPTTPSPLML
jgi:hypothetical protein